MTEQTVPRSAITDVLPIHTSDSATIPLTQGKVAIVDADMLGELLQYNWCVVNCRGDNWYALRREWPSKRGILMHRVVMDCLDSPLKIDHINENGLDNRRHNLRFATTSQNGANSSKTRGSSRYRGVSKHEQKWRAEIKVNYRAVYLGRFNTEVEAAQAYDTAARSYFGEFARTNF